MNWLERVWSDYPKAKFVLPLAVLGVVAGWSLYTSGDDTDPAVTAPNRASAQAAGKPSAQQQQPATNGAVGTIAERDFDCVVEPFQVIKLAPSATGVIGALYTERGQRISRNQLLGKLDDRVELAQLAEDRVLAANTYTAGAIRARLEYLRVDQQRQQDLADKRVVALAKRDQAISDTHVAEQQLQEAVINQRTAQLEVNRLEAVLRQKQMISPFDGVVTDVLLHPGEYRDEQSPVLTLAQVDPLRVEVFVPTRYFGQITQRTAAMVKPEKPIGGNHPAKVTIVDSVLDPASSTFGVRLEMANPGHIVPAGLQCKVHFS